LLFILPQGEASHASRVDNFGVFTLIIKDKMSRIATARVLLAVLAVAILLLNPAGVCAGTVGAASPSHPCCPKPAVEKAACICIDRQSDPPTVPSLTPQADAELLVTSPTLQQATAVESNAEPALALPAQDRIITLHQILV
jgi:hypothetical protein